MRIDSVRKGASGVATVAAGGSSFLVRLDYLTTLGMDPEGLAPGTELAGEAEAALRLAAEATEAEKRALALIARAEQCRAGLVVKLEKRAIGHRAALLVLERLSAEGLLDDLRYAEAWIRSRLGRVGEKGNSGPAKLALSLRARGIDEDTVKKALSAVLGPDERKMALSRAASHELARSDGDREEAASRLRALGYKAGEIRAYFDERE